MNSQPSSSSTRTIVRVGGGAPATTMRTRPRPGISPSQCGSGVEHRGHHGRRGAHDRDAVLLDPPQDLHAVDLAQHDLGHAHAGHRERHPPAVAVEHRQRVQVDVAVADAGVPAERRGVDPDVAVGHLHALGPGGRAGRVVDGRRGVLVGLPRPRVRVAGDHQVVVGPDDVGVLGLDALQVVGELGVDEQHPGAGVLDDVGDLVAREPEVHRHQHPPVAAHAPERRQQPRAVVADHGHALAEPDAELVELRRDAACPLAHLGVGDRAPRGSGLVRLVDDARAVAVDGHGAVQEVAHTQRDDHVRTLPPGIRIVDPLTRGEDRSP